MMRTGSLQRRLSVGLLGVITVLWIAASVVAGFLVRNELDEAYDNALRETAHRLLSLAVLQIARDDDTGRVLPHRVAAYDDEGEDLTYLVRDPSGRVLIRSHDADQHDFPEKPSTGFRDTRTHRIYGAAAISGTIVIEIAEPLNERREATLEATLALAAPLSILIPLCFLGVWWLVRRSFHPVLTLRAGIEARGGENLSPVTADGLPNELKSIAESVNRLLSRLRKMLEAERAFAANSAHELRTPIAAALAQTQRLIAESPEGDAKERAQTIEAELHGLARLASKLLELTKAEGGSVLTETETDLTTIIRFVMDDCRRAGHEKDRLVLTQADGASLRSHMDPDAFAILLRNLIENALKHGDRQATVHIDVTEPGVVKVINEGPVVPPDILRRLTTRFERGSTTATGTGLGLAIAETIAIGAHASLVLYSPALGRENGFEAHVRFAEQSPPNDL